MCDSLDVVRPPNIRRLAATGRSKRQADATEQQQQREGISVRPVHSQITRDRYDWQWLSYALVYLGFDPPQ